MVEEISSSRAGKWTVVAIAVVATGLSSFAWWYHASHSQLVRQHWGIEAVLAIRNAKHVVLLRLVPSETGSRVVSGERYSVDRTIQLDGHPGLIHFRSALLQEATYQPARKPPSRPRWLYVLQFTDESLSRPVELAYSPADRVLARGDGSDAIALGKMSAALEQYLSSVSSSSLGPSVDR